MTKKAFATIGMVVSVLIAVMGVLVIAGQLGGQASSASSAPYTYESGYASFGADFYTYVSNNAGEAASASRTAANNIRELCELLTNVSGIFLIGFGLLGVCYFGIHRCSCEEAKGQPEFVPEQPAAGDENAPVSEQEEAPAEESAEPEAEEI